MDASCGCFLAKPAALLGLSTLHSSLCMKHAESRFCMPVSTSAFLIRAQSGSALDDRANTQAVLSDVVDAFGELGLVGERRLYETDAVDDERQRALVEAAVKTVTFSSSPPRLMTNHKPTKKSMINTYNTLDIKWEMAKLLLE